MAGNFFFLNPYKSVFTVTCQNYLYFGGFSSGNFRGISALRNVADIVVLSFTYFDFFSVMKRV